jgi:hypothetical protein
MAKLFLRMIPFRISNSDIEPCSGMYVGPLLPIFLLSQLVECPRATHTKHLSADRNYGQAHSLPSTWTNPPSSTPSIPGSCTDIPVHAVHYIADAVLFFRPPPPPPPPPPCNVPVEEVVNRNFSAGFQNWLVLLTGPDGRISLAPEGAVLQSATQRGSIRQVQLSWVPALLLKRF